MFRKIISYFIYGAALVIVVVSVFDSHGLVQLSSLIKDERSLKNKESELKLTIDKKRAELAAIENNPSELEQRARNDLGLSREGEILYVQKNLGK